MAAAASYPKLKILKATYGLTEDKKVDAAPKLERMMKENNGVLLIEKKQDLNMLFGDPEPKAAKKLVLTYQYGDDGDVLTDEIGESGPSRERDIKYEAEDKPTDKMFGRLIVTVHRAADLKDVASFGGKMDPYYTLTCGSEKFTSKTAEKAHTNPNWDGQHALNLDGSEDVLHLTFTDKRLLGDTHIGRADLPLGTLAAHTEAQWFTISEMANFNKQAGKVLVTAAFKGRGGPRPPKKSTAPAAAAVAAAAAPAQVVYVAVPAVPVPQQKEAEAPKCVCDKGHAMVAHTEDRCWYTCTGCQKGVSGSVGRHYQCQTCPMYWLCATCSAAAIANGYSPSEAVTAPVCDKNHLCSDYTGRKPVGYHNEYKCDVCAKQHAFGQVVKYWHCDPCQFDCCVPCGEKFVKAGPAPAFKKLLCAKGHKMAPGWNHTPADAKGQTFACSACHKTKRYTPAHNYYHCAQAGCHESICGDCVAAKPAAH